MAISILSRTISAAVDKKIVLSNSQWAGKMTIGSSWNTLRIAGRIAFTSSGVGAPGAFAMGLMSDPTAGMTNGFLGSNTKNFLGFGSTAAWGYNAGLGYDNTVKKMGKILTTTTVAGINTTLITNNPASYRNILMLEIIRGSPNFTVNYIRPNGSGLEAGVDVALTTLRSAIVAATLVNAATTINTLTGGGVAYGASGPDNIAIDEATNGSLNAITVAWGGTTINCEISEMIFAVIA